VLSWHTYERRALEVDAVLGGLLRAAQAREGMPGTPREHAASLAGKDDGQATDPVVLGGPDLTPALTAEVET